MTEKTIPEVPKTVSSMGRRKILVGGSLGIGSVALGAATASIAARPGASATKWDLRSRRGGNW
jgi:hypothetical protein